MSRLPSAGICPSLRGSKVSETGAVEAGTSGGRSCLVEIRAGSHLRMSILSKGGFSSASMHA